MFKKIASFFGSLFKENHRFHFDPKSITIPEAFNYSVTEYRDLVDELKSFLVTGDRLSALNHFITSGLPGQYNMNLDNPNHAALLGYAFAVAINIKKDAETKTAAQKALEFFQHAQGVPINSEIN